MARTVRDTSLETRAARARLKARKKPYWRAIEQGTHFGYYKGAQGGKWCARYYLGEQRYTETTLGLADDVLDADGVTVLDFRRAQAKARDWYVAQISRIAGHNLWEHGSFTVADAMREYLNWYAHHRKPSGLVGARSVVEAHILPALGREEVAKLTARKIRNWHQSLAEAPARLRSRRGSTPNTRQTSNADAKRQRKVTANRILTVLKAGLNYAFRDGIALSDESWRRVRPFQRVNAPVIGYLTEAECRRLVNACSVDLRQLVRAALLTGCRYGELAVLKAADFNPEAGTLAIRASKSGRTRHVVLTEEGQDFFADSVIGLAGNDIVFRRAGGGPWGRSHQRRPMMQACKRAQISPPASFHILRHTHGSQLAMTGVPLAVIAEQLGHADTRMTERHYAHLAPRYVADTIRANFPVLGIVERRNVTRLGLGRRPRPNGPQP